MTTMEFLLTALVILQALLLLELLRFRRMIIPIGETFFALASALAAYMRVQTANLVAKDATIKFDDILKNMKDLAEKEQRKQEEQKA